MENQTTTSALIKNKTATREKWLEARLKLLEAEKKLTRQSDEVAKQRQNLPWVKINKEYIFETDEGNVSLADMFKGRSQLLVYHFMFGPDYNAGCPHCSAIADGFNGFWQHLAQHDVMLWAVSRAPYSKLQAFKKRMEWTFPWASSFESDFNFDFNVSFTEEQQRNGDVDYNYNQSSITSRESNIRKEDEAPPEGVKIAATVGTDWATYTKEAPGMSAFVIDDGIIYHTYSTYARGLDGLWGLYQWLDRAPLGRNESGSWMQHHDEYENKIQENSYDTNCCK